MSGGYIQTEDIYGFNAYHAPDNWLGNQSDLYGGVLHLSQRVLTSDGTSYPLVVLAGGGTVLQYRSLPPGTDWTTYVVPLIATGGWEVGNGSGDPGIAASKEQMVAVLSNLSWFALDADWNTGPDQVGLDEVFVTRPDDMQENLTTVPEPAALLFTVSGLVSLAAVALFRKRSNG